MRSKYLLLLLFFCSKVHSLELVVWNRYIGTDLTGTDAFVSTFYCSDNTYTSYSISSGKYDGDLFNVDSPNRTLQTAGTMSEGDYTIEIAVSNGTNTYKRTVELTVGPAKVCPQVSASTNHSLLLTRNGDVYAAGNGNNGQLGNGNFTNPNRNFTQINTPSPSLSSGDYICRIHAGHLSSCLVTRNGKFYFAGLCNTTQTSQFTRIDSDLSSKHVVQAVGGSSNQYILCDDGTIYARGSSSDGALGDGNTASSTTGVSIIASSAPGASTGPLAGKLTIQIQAADNGCLILNSDSTLYGWGGNRDGLLGLGDTSTYDSPTQISSGGLSGKLVDQIVSGVYSSFLFTSDGTLLGCGNNISSQLALGDTINRTTFVASTNSLFTTHPPAYISCGRDVVQMLSTTGAVIGWGDNTLSVAGGTTPSVITVTGKTVTALAAGIESALYLATDGTITSRGSRGEGITGLLNDTSSFQESFAAMGANQNLVNNHLEGASHVVLSLSTHFSISWSSYQISEENLYQL